MPVSERDIDDWTLPQSLGAGTMQFMQRWGKFLDADGGYAQELEDALLAVPPNWREQARSACDKGFSRCESPIEKSLLPWLVCQRYQFFDFDRAVLFPGEHSRYKPHTLAVIPQLPIGRYRVDFALAASRGGLIRFVVVECDGKEFHDPARDAQRDAEIRKNKRVLDIVRIDGSLIFQDAEVAGCVVAKAVLEAWAKR
jgi:very-short-patch-repair endonuclease